MLGCRPPLDSIASNSALHDALIAGAGPTGLTCTAQFEGSLRGYVIVPEQGDVAHYVDAGGHARAAYGSTSLFVTRPDNYVGLTTKDADASAVIEYLKQCVRPVPR